MERVADNSLRGVARLQIFRTLTVFVLRLRPEPSVDAIKALRWLLKKAQRLGLKAVEVTEEEGGEGAHQGVAAPSRPCSFNGGTKPQPNQKATTMRRSELFPSIYYKGSDFMQPQVKTINYVDFKLFPDSEHEKAIVHFEGGSRLLILNLTNFNSISEIAGSDETNDWPGTRIELHSVQMTIHGEVKNGVRVRRPPPHQAPIHGARRRGRKRSAPR
jgi:hypothetical protein